MATQNITLSLPRETLKKVKLIAVERQTSVSRLMTALLEELVRAEDRYEQAMRQHMAVLKKGFDLGTGGAIPWSREDLHER